MENKKTIILDLTDCKHFLELHERIRIAFDFPEWYGKNLDAFWDLLWSDCDADEVVIRGVNTMPDDFIEYMNRVYCVLDRHIEKMDKYSKLYDDIRPFSYRVES